MKQKIIGALLALHCAWAGAQAQESHSVASKNKVSVVEWLDGVEYDAGLTPQGQIVKRAFRYRNLGERPLLLQNARADCSCATPDWTEAPVPPGGQGQIVLSYDGKREGAYNKRIRVFFDQQRRPEILRIKGEITPRSGAQQ
ncbi:MAG: DUF1573 domain-containing protein [Saprospiraceae bacterium]